MELRLASAPLASLGIRLETRNGDVAVAGVEPARQFIAGHPASARPLLAPTAVGIASEGTHHGMSGRRGVGEHRFEEGAIRGHADPAHDIWANAESCTSAMRRARKSGSTKCRTSKCLPGPG